MLDKKTGYDKNRKVKGIMSIVNSQLFKLLNQLAKVSPSPLA